MNRKPTPGTNGRLSRWPSAGPSGISPWLAAAALAVAVLSPVSARAEAAATDCKVTSYLPGRGWTLPCTDLTLGGYGSAEAGKLEGEPWSLDLSHLSLFLSWHSVSSRLQFFSEAEVENALTIQAKRTADDGAHLDLERIYADWEQADELKVRFGKFLTPVGRWNLIHAQPLVWTTSRPLTTEAAFPTNATGGMLFGTLPEIGDGLDYSAYASLPEELRPDPDEDSFTKAYGLHLDYPLGPLRQLGFSFANFEQKNEPDERKNLVGLDFSWARNGFELSSEGVYRFSSQGSGGDEKGGFVQGVIPVAARWFLVGRYEYFHESGADRFADLWLGGIDYRPNRYLIIKSEYSRASNNSIQAPEGFLASIAVLF